MDRRRLAWGGLGVAALVLLVAWLAAWLVLPHVAKRQVEQRLGAWLGRTVRVAEVDVQPHALALTVHKLAVAPLKGAGREPQFAATRVHMDFNWSSLWRWAPVLEALEVDKPRLRATRLADGQYDVDDILARIAPREGENLPDFALFNLQLRDGEARLDDKPAARSHRITKLELALPFLSNLPSDLAVKVEPKLAFLLNGAPFDSGITATPFGPKRSADLTLKVDGYALDPLAAYWPKELGVRPNRGRLDANLALRFAQTEQGAQVVLRGELNARDVRFVQAGGETVASWQLLHAQLADVQPLARRAHLGLLQVQGLDVELARDAAGQFNLTAPPAPKRDALPALPAVVAGPAPAASAPAAAAATPWHWKLDQLMLVKSRVRWRDARTEPAADIVAQVLDLTLEQPQWPLREPMGIKLAADMALPGDKAPSAGRLVLEGTLASDTALLQLQADALQLAPLHPYLAQWLLARPEGKLSTQATLEWAQGEGARGKLKFKGLKLNDFRLVEGTGASSRTAAAWKALELAGDTEIDWLERSAKAGKLLLQQPLLALARDAQGRLNAERWLVPPPKAASGSMPAKTASAPAAGASAPGAWKLALQEAKLEAGTLRWQDASTVRPVALQLDNLKFVLPALQWPADAQAKPLPLQVAARMAPVPSKDAPANATRGGGALDWRGQWLWQPTLRAEGKLTAEQLPLHLLAPYLGLPAAVELQRADGNVKGELLLTQDPKAGWTLRLAGDATVAEVNLQARRAGGGSDELLAWQSLALPGLVATLAPGAAPLVEVPEATLGPWQARLVVADGGGLNLLAPLPVAVPPAAASASAVSAASAASAASAVSAASGAQAATATAAAVARTAASAPPAARTAAASAATPWQVLVGRTRLAGGRLELEDRHVKPGVSLAVTDLAGTLGRWHSGGREPVSLDLKGKLAGSGAPLELAGSVGPTGGKHVVAELRLRAAELDAAALSPYAGKYGGQALARGKLALDMAYKLQADGKLDAQHRLGVQQLALGDKVDSADAVKLPLALALAVLKDRNGNFELNLPVAGSLADAQFSLPAAFGRQLQAALTKAAATPLAAMVGGDDLMQAEFDPGTARLTERGRATLDRLARALLERPALQLALSGSADAATERDAAGGPERVKELALQRATVAREHLAARGVPAERLVITALRMRGTGPEDAAWTPRVYLAVSGQ